MHELTVTAACCENMKTLKYTLYRMLCSTILDIKVKSAKVELIPSKLLV
jgi:hypothetical protein